MFPLFSSVVVAEMDKDTFFTIMEFPRQWREWNMFPDELCAGFMANYKPGNENSSDHTRNGVFHWWLSQSPSKDHLIKLVKLSFLDPDPGLGTHMRDYIKREKNCDAEVLELMQGKA